MDETIILSKLNEVLFSVKCNQSQMMELRTFFSCHVPNYRWNPKFRAKIWDGKISFFDARRMTFPIGLLSEFMTFTEKFNYKYKFDFDASQLYNTIDDDDLIQLYNLLFDNNKDYYPRDYQQDAIKKMLVRKRGTIESATGSGKSLVIYVITKFLQLMGKKVLIIVPTVSLVEQMFSDFQSYGWLDAGVYCTKLYAKPGREKNINFDKPVLISTWQSLYKKDTSFFEKYSCVFGDEAHQAKSLSIKTILEKCTNADYRFGTTGTLQSEEADVKTIYGYLGPKIYELKSKELIDKGILSKIIIANLLLKYPEEMVKRIRQRDYAGEVEEILTYKPRYKAIDFIINNTVPEHNTLLLCHRIEHLKKTVEYVKEKFPKRIVYTIYGAIDAEERERIRKLMEQQSGVVLCATYKTMGTGVNITKIHQIIFFSSYKSKITVLQSIGRGLRLNETKSKLILWDVVDNATWTKRTGNIGKNYIYEHWEERMKYYKQQGFESISKSLEI
jgi:superfamily II DNA or RNA helicase